MTWLVKYNIAVPHFSSSCSISPGNVITPLWEELAGQSPDAAAAIRAGERCQVSRHLHERLGL